MARGPLRISRADQPRTVKHLGPGTLDFALRRVRGGKRAVMEELAPLAMQFEPRLKPAILKWAALSAWQRRSVTLDDLADEAGMTQGEFLAAIVRAGFEFTMEITDLLIGTDDDRDGASSPVPLDASVRRDSREDFRTRENRPFSLSGGGSDRTAPTPRRGALELHLRSRISLSDLR